MSVGDNDPSLIHAMTGSGQQTGSTAGAMLATVAEHGQVRAVNT